MRKSKTSLGLWLKKIKANSKIFKDLITFIFSYLSAICPPSDENKRKGKITETYYTTEGTLYKDSIVRIENISTKSSYARVKDELGKIFYVNTKDLVLL